MKRDAIIESEKHCFFYLHFSLIKKKNVPGTASMASMHIKLKCFVIVDFPSEMKMSNEHKTIKNLRFEL